MHDHCAPVSGIAVTMGATCCCPAHATGTAGMLALASDFARQVLVVDRQVSLLAMLALVVTPVVYVRMHWLALEVPMCTCMARMSALARNSGHATRRSTLVKQAGIMVTAWSSEQ